MLGQPINAFIKAVKEQRDLAIESFRAGADGMNNGSRTDTTFMLENIKSVDLAIAGVLDLVEERIEELVDVSALTEDGEPADRVDIEIVSDLSTLYFTEVSS